MVAEIAAFNVFRIIGGGGFAPRSHVSRSHQITCRHNSTADYFLIPMQEHRRAAVTVAVRIERKSTIESDKSQRKRR